MHVWEAAGNAGRVIRVLIAMTLCPFDKVKSLRGCTAVVSAYSNPVFACTVVQDFVHSLLLNADYFSPASSND